MTQYINKSALIAEIERLISDGQVKLQESEECNDYESYVAWSEHIATCKKVLSIIDTLEVKEADFDEEFNKYHIGLYNPFNSGTEIYGFAKHFYELGLNAQKEE